MARRSDVETFCALRLFFDSCRWASVPWYLRSGKYLADTATEVLVQLKPAPQRLFADSTRWPANGALFTREDAVEAAWAAVDPSSRGTIACARTRAAGGRRRPTR